MKIISDREPPKYKDKTIDYISSKWTSVILAAGQEMQIYSSPNLKEWQLESRFGEGQGAHGGVWECPDLIELPIEGTRQMLDTVVTLISIWIKKNITNP